MAAKEKSFDEILLIDAITEIQAGGVAIITRFYSGIRFVDTI